MLCSINVDISRLRRVFVASFFKREYRKSFLKLPITEQSLFAKDFDNLSEKVVKGQSSIKKVLKKTSSFLVSIFLISI